MDAKSRSSRRGFLWGAAASGAAVTAVATLPKGQPADTTPEPPPPPAPERGGGYRLSEHVKQYYKTTLV